MCGRHAKSSVSAPKTNRARPVPRTIPSCCAGVGSPAVGAHRHVVSLGLLPSLGFVAFLKHEAVAITCAAAAASAASAVLFAVATDDGAPCIVTRLSVPLIAHGSAGELASIGSDDDRGE